MVKTFGGHILFLDRSDINTDEIIPAKYLTEVKKEALSPYLLEDLKLDGFDPRGSWRGRAKVAVTRANFGCGSSREHAPWSLETNDIMCVIAESYARIFRQNMFNGGMLAIELSADKIDEIFKLREIGGKDNVNCDVSIEAKTLTFTFEGGTKVIDFTLSQFDEALVKAGGWVEFADEKY